MAFDLREYIELHFQYIPPGPGSDEYQIDCLEPGCDDAWRRGKHMTLNVKTGKGYCFKCGAKYGPAKIVKLYEDIPWHQAFEKVVGKFILPANLDELLSPAQKAIENLQNPSPPPQPAGKTVLDMKLPTIQLPMTFPIFEGSEAFEYLRKRRFGAYHRESN